MRVLSLTAGVTNPRGALGEVTATLNRPMPPTKPVWPAGTYATASSFHAPNSDNGVVRSYASGNAIDGDTTSFWNDDTEGLYPDTLTVTTAIAVTLPRVTVLSSSDGVPQDCGIRQGG